MEGHLSETRLFYSLHLERQVETSELVFLSPQCSKQGLGFIAKD